MASNSTHIPEEEKKRKETRKKAARSKRKINAVDTHDFTLGSADEKEKKAFNNLDIFFFSPLLSFFCSNMLENAQRNKTYSFSSF